MKIVWLPLADNQRNDQLEYIAQDKPQAAAAMDEAVSRIARLLADQPKMGRRGRCKGTRELVVAGTPFIVVYRIAANRIEIIRFLHGSQQWPPVL